ncbi:MAG: hypothetical protein GY800_06695 [Planctomycetes bacterium]|nr:hypothetical protein [Planctomycetota bacterium]
MKVGDIEIIIGSDPELFVKRDGSFVSGHDLIPGTKEAPFPVRGGAVQVDGTALEFNTKPAKTRQGFHNSTNMVLKALREMISDDLELTASPTAHYEEKYMKELPELAKMLGCSPDFNAYTGFENPAPNVNAPFRTGAGHIHVGWTEDADIQSEKHLADCRALVQAMDLFLGVPSVFLDGDDLRRELYGQAGAFRPKTYGVEYRVLSNFWVLNAKLRGWVYNNTIHAVERLMDHENKLIFSSTAKDAINYNSDGLARTVIEAFDVPLPRGFKFPPQPVSAYAYGYEPLEIRRLGDL